MPTTTVHLPPELVKALDSLAARRRESRNRLVVEACQRLVEQDLGEWPAGFFDLPHLTSRDRRELEGAGKELEEIIRATRHNRRQTPF